MLKVKTVYDYRQELCDALRSGKYRLSNASGYHCRVTNTYCAIGVAAAELGVNIGTQLPELCSKLGISSWQRHKIERTNDDSDDETRVAAVTAYIESLP